MAQTRSSAAAEMLAAWEAGLQAGAAQRTLALLEHAAGLAPKQVVELAVGRGDALLLELRERSFGTRMECESSCPRCRERLEFTLDTRALRADAPAEPGAGLHRIEHGGRSVRFRLPTLGDLDACAAAGDEGSAARALLARCLAEPSADATMLDDDTLAEAISQRLGVLDPQAVTTIAMSCPACGHAWDELFDIGGFFAREVDGWAQRTLEEVHLLASHYGWPEHEILALTPARRRHYVERVSG